MRPHTPGDAADSTALWGDRQVTRYIGGRPFTPEEVWARLLRYAGHWALLGYGYWTLREQATGAFIGEVGFADFRRDLTAAPDQTAPLELSAPPDTKLHKTLEVLASGAGKRRHRR